MSRWDDEFQNHEIHNGLESFQETVESAKQVAALRDQNRFEDIIRTEQVIEFVRNKLKLVDPNLVSSNLINQLNQDIRSANSQLQEFVKTENIGNLNNTNSQIDNLLNRISNFNVFITEKDFENLNDTIISFRRSVGQHLRHLNDEIENVEARLPSLSEDLSELKKQIQQQKSRTDEIVTGFQKQFSETEEKRREEYSNKKNERQKEHDNLITEERGRFDEEIKNIKEDSASVISELNNKKEKAAEIVRIISNSGMAGGFEEVAGKERVARNIFRGAAVLAFLGLIGFGFHVFNNFPEGGMEISAISIRIFVGATIGILIAYLAKQADKHEKHFRQNKIIALQMAALDPYISNFDESEQKTIKKELTTNFFHRYDPDNRRELKSGEFETRGNLKDLLQFFKKLAE